MQLSFILPYFDSMKKLLLTLFSVLLMLGLSAQTVEPIEKGNLFGVQFLNENGDKTQRIEPIYEDIMVYVKVKIGNLDLGSNYSPARYWHDTEYIEVPVDPNDPSKVETDTIISNYRYYHPGKLVLAKNNGKWGGLTESGNAILPFEYESFAEYNWANWSNFGSDRLPVIFLTKGKEQTLIDAKGEVIIKPEQFPAYFSKLNRKIDALELSFFGDYLLFNEGGVLADSLIKVPAEKEVVKGKTVIKAPAYSYSVYTYKYGRFNVLNLKTGEKLWAEPKKNIEIKFKDPNNVELYESLNPRTLSSIKKYSENRGLGIAPSSIEFVGKD
jgi:hypothetical protein